MKKSAQSFKRVGILIVFSCLFATVIPAKTAGASESQALKLLGKSSSPVSGLTRKNPVIPNSNLTKNYGGQNNQHSRSRTSRLNGDAGMFFDLNRTIEVEAETWQGSAGLQINW